MTNRRAREWESMGRASGVDAPPALACEADLAFATLRRRVVQARIVEKVRRHLRGAGPGPIEWELQTFARFAIAEERLARMLGRPVSDRMSMACGSDPDLMPVRRIDTRDGERGRRELA